MAILDGDASLVVSGFFLILRAPDRDYALVMESGALLGESVTDVGRCRLCACFSMQGRTLEMLTARCLCYVCVVLENGSAMRSYCAFCVL